MSLDMIIKNGKIVTATHSYSGTIGVDKGRIVCVGNEALPLEAANTIDAKGKYVLPGVVDPHIHLGFKNPFEVESDTETQAGAGSGVTTMGIYMPFKVGDGIIKTFHESEKKFEDNSHCDAFFHAFVRDDATLEDIDKAPSVGITSFKFSVGYKGPQARLIGMPDVDDGFFFEGFERVGSLGRPVWAAVHAENIDIALRLRERLMKQGRKDMAAWNDSRPNFVEAECMNRCIMLADVAKCPLYIVHMTIGEGVDIVAKAMAEGKEVVAETCPQYLTHNSEDPMPMLRDNPPLANVNPPLRDKASNARLWEGIKDGVIKVIGADQSVASLEQKGNDIWNAPMGLGNLTEFVLPVMLSEGVNKGRISLEKVVEVCCENPAKIFGIYPKKGTIAVGADADFVIVDMNKKVKFTQDLSNSICDWNIYEGWDFTGWPVMTILRGQVTAKDGKIVAKKGIGRYIPREVK